MKIWMLGGAALIATAGGAAGYLFAPSKTQGEALAYAKAEVASVDTGSQPTPEGMNEALEDRRAILFDCGDTDPLNLGTVAGSMANSSNYAAAASAAGCILHEDPATFGGPMVSMENQFGTTMSTGPVSYHVGSFAIGNPAGSGRGVNGIVRWDRKAAVTAKQAAVLLDSYLDFASPRDCEPGISLTRIREAMYASGSAFVGPYKMIDVRKFGPDKDDITRRILPISGNWHGLPLREFRLVGQDETGLGWMEFVFDAPASVVGPVVSRMGFGVQEIGDTVERDLDGPQLSVALTREGSATVLTCGVST